MKLPGGGDRFNAIPSPWLWWKDTIAQAAYGSREQLFVRIASDEPLERWWKDPGFQTIVGTVAAMGLYSDGRTGRSAESPPREKLKSGKAGKLKFRNSERPPHLTNPGSTSAPLRLERSGRELLVWAKAD